MKLYKISQSKNNDYDTYDSAIVCAESEEEAKTICPDEYAKIKDGMFMCIFNDFSRPCDSWCTYPEDVEAEYLGDAREGMEKGVVLNSFNAG